MMNLEGCLGQAGKSPGAPNETVESRWEAGVLWTRSPTAEVELESGEQIKMNPANRRTCRGTVTVYLTGPRGG